MTFEEMIEERFGHYISTIGVKDCTKMYKTFQELLEKPFLKLVYERAGSISQAARMLGMNRATLRTRLKKYKII
jgi:DNA-binding protein Fis